jgi:CheY-like chemotaxis protein
LSLSDRGELAVPFTLTQFNAKCGTDPYSDHCLHGVLYWLELFVARKVLLVDDEPLMLEVVADMLGDLGCEVMTANNGQEALEKLSAESRIEILITDINMPGMDGYELAETAMLRRTQLKVILLSGRENNTHGFPLIRKPFLRGDLERTMAANAGLR